jgi:23S rRNA pseudouridine1911/1915/1917 synthase
MKITILYEDTNLLVLNKPAGISVHGDGKDTGEYTVADFILENYPKLKNVGEKMEIPRTGGGKVDIPRPGIVHRLDKETSGALIVAKNKKTFEFLKNQFQEHTIQKTYRAFVYGKVADPQASLATGKRGRITAPIGRSPNDVRMWTAGRGARGSNSELREAVTEYNVLDRFYDTDDEMQMKKVEHQFSYIEAFPKTGRTHQIRVHFRYLNHPIVSDPLYRGSKEKALGMKRLALHAYTITFTIPKGEVVTVEAPLPADFKKVIKEYNLKA